MFVDSTFFMKWMSAEKNNLNFTSSLHFYCPHRQVSEQRGLFGDYIFKTMFNVYKNGYSFARREELVKRMLVIVYTDYERSSGFFGLKGCSARFIISSGITILSMG